MLERIAERPTAEDERPLLLWKEAGFEKVAFPVHIARVALQNPALELVAVVRPSPDDPQLALTEHPVKLAAYGGLIVGINANAFEEGGFWDKLTARAGQAVSLYGEAVAEGHFFPGKFDLYGGTLWVTPVGAVNIAMLEEDVLSDMTGVRNAVSGFHQLIKDGQLIRWGAPDGDYPERMARSAAGVSADGRWLYLVLAEGRRTLFSRDGYSEQEVARLLSEFHCSTALMLDCGGSSALVANPGKGPSLVNRPADGRARPVPVLLGVRYRELP